MKFHRRTRTLKETTEAKAARKGKPRKGVFKLIRSLKKSLSATPGHSFLKSLPTQPTQLGLFDAPPRAALPIAEKIEAPRIIAPESRPKTVIKRGPKKTKRTDPHRPGAIVPTDYSLMTMFAMPTDKDAGFGMPEMQAMVRAGVARHATIFGSAGQCGVCGARFGYGDLWEHVPTNDLVFLGHECAEKYELAANRDDWMAGLESLKKGRAAYLRGVRNREAIEAVYAANPGLEEALKTAHPIVSDLGFKLKQYQDLSEKQIALAFKIAREEKEKASRPVQVERNVPVPISDKRQKVTGKVVSVKTTEGSYGLQTRCTVKVETPEGSWLVNGSLPDLKTKDDEGYRHVHKGDTIAFEAQLEPGKDAHFAFFKRPTKTAVVARGVEGLDEDAINLQSKLWHNPELGEAEKAKHVAELRAIVDRLPPEKQRHFLRPGSVLNPEVSVDDPYAQFLDENKL